MNLLKNKIIEELIKQLSSLKSIYKDEVNIVINDLYKKDTKSLITFVKKNYQDKEISEEMKQFVTSLVEKEIIPISYLQKIHKDNDKTQEERNAELRKKIIEARKTYLSDANGFIAKLELMNEEEIYNSLLNFYDISLMQHCIKNLNEETLLKLFRYVETKLKNNPHSAMDIFLEGSIKSHLKNT